MKFSLKHRVVRDLTIPWKNKRYPRASLILERVPAEIIITRQKNLERESRGVAVVLSLFQ
jgi:hypothetical protein